MDLFLIQQMSMIAVFVRSTISQHKRLAATTSTTAAATEASTTAAIAEAAKRLYPKIAFLTMTHHRVVFKLLGTSTRRTLGKLLQLAAKRQTLVTNYLHLSDS